MGQLFGLGSRVMCGEVKEAAVAGATAVDMLARGRSGESEVRLRRSVRADRCGKLLDTAEPNDLHTKMRRKDGVNTVQRVPVAVYKCPSRMAVQPRNNERSTRLVQSRYQASLCLRLLGGQGRATVAEKRSLRRTKAAIPLGSERARRGIGRRRESDGTTKRPTAEGRGANRQVALEAGVGPTEWSERAWRDRWDRRLRQASWRQCDNAERSV